MTFSSVSLDHDLHYTSARFSAPLALAPLTLRPSLCSPPHSSHDPACSRLSRKYCAMRRHDIAKRKTTGKTKGGPLTSSLASFSSSSSSVLLPYLGPPVRERARRRRGPLDRPIQRSPTNTRCWTLHTDLVCSVRRRDTRYTGPQRAKPPMDLAQANTDESSTCTRGPIVTRRDLPASGHATPSESRVPNAALGSSRSQRTLTSTEPTRSIYPS